MGNFDIFFKEFKKNWSTNDQIVFYGASKDFVQLIETLDIILENKIKLEFIIDDKIEGVFKNIYDLNEAVYLPDGKINENKRSIEVKNSDLFLKENIKTKKYKIIVSSDSKKNQYFKKLLSLGYKQNKDFCDYKEYVSLIPYIEQDMTHIWRADIMLTEKCTLNCTFCNMYMPHFKNPKHRNLDEIKSDLDSFFSLIDYVSIFHLVGGEPLMYPQVNDVIDYVGKKFRDKMGRMLITTNGTLTPKEKTMNLIKQYKCLVMVSDYTKEIKYKRRLDNLVKILKENHVSFIVREDISWSDFGHPEVIKFKKEKDVISHFKKCTAPYKGINNGKYYFCHLNTSANLAGMIPINDNDFCDLNKINKYQLLEHDLGFLKLGYSTFCKNCYGCNTGIEIPVGPGVQGIRKI